MHECLDDLESRDVEAMIAVLPQLTFLRRIQLHGKMFSKVSKSPDISVAKNQLGGSVPLFDRMEMRAAKELPNPWNMSLSQSPQVPGKVRFSRRADLIPKLMKSISRNLLHSGVLTDLRLVGLKVSRESWRTLATGLKGKATLSYLAVNYCKLSDEDLAELSPALERLASLRKLDFSNNALSNTAGFHLGRIISLHGERKDKVIWVSGLRSPRYTYIDKDWEGLQELCLANNSLDNFAICDLCRVLSLDTWVKVLDLRRNPFGIDGLNEIRSMMRSNSTLIIVDVRETSVEQRKEAIEILSALWANLRRAEKGLLPSRFRKFEAHLKELEANFPAPVSSIPISPHSTSRRLKLRRSLSTQASPNTTNRSPHSTLPCTSLVSDSRLIDLKISGRDMKSGTASTRSRISLSSSQHPGHVSTLKDASSQDSKLHYLEDLVSELTTVLDSLEEDYKRNLHNCH